MSTPTPRTDDLAGSLIDAEEEVPADFARTLERELAHERAIVSRIWVQLGSPTYEQLKGRSIYDLIDELKAELAFQVARNSDLFAQRDEAVEAQEKAEAELKAEQDNSAIAEIELKVSRAIVSKIWVQLGSPTYQQLKGRSIYDLIDELKAELATERARMDWLESVMAPDANYCEVFFAGLRNWTGSAHAFQIESNPRKFPTLNAPTVRAAIDAAMKEGK